MCGKRLSRGAQLRFGAAIAASALVMPACQNKQAEKPDPEVVAPAYGAPPPTAPPDATTTAPAPQPSVAPNPDDTAGADIYGGPPADDPADAPEAKPTPPKPDGPPAAVYGAPPPDLSKPQPKK